MMKVHHNYSPLVIFFSFLTFNSFHLHAQTMEQIKNFLVAKQSKNWIGTKEAKADSNNDNDNIKFKFYRNGRVEKYVLEDDVWKKYKGTWRLYKSGNTWLMDIIGKTFRIQPHFAETDEKEKLVLLDYDDFNAGRTVNVYTLRANGFK